MAYASDLAMDDPGLDEARAQPTNGRTGMKTSVDKESLTTQHTPTPWNVNGLSIEDQNGDLIGFLNAGDGVATAHEDAAFIVRAVNCHEELIEALRSLFGAIKFSGWNIDDLKWTQPMAEARKAIAKAEGK
jgi:hypothetical protein